MLYIFRRCNVAFEHMLPSYFLGMILVQDDIFSPDHKTHFFRIQSLSMEAEIQYHSKFYGCYACFLITPSCSLINSVQA